MASNAISRVPIELWAEIRSHVPSISKHVIAEALRFTHLGFTHISEDKHSRLWYSLFHNEKWLDAMIEKGLNPVLIGYDLKTETKPKYLKTETKPKYLVLVLGRDGDGGKYGKPNVTGELSLFFDSLKPHTKLGSGELYFPETKITLNYYDAIHNYHYTTITQPHRLVSQKLGGLHSAYLYWNDNSFKVKTIRPRRIVGISRRALTDDVSNIVGLSWKHLPGRKLRQHFFQIAGMENKTDQIDNGKRDASFKVESIEYIHTKSYIHRDIKPANCLIGIGTNENQVSLIDFGLATRYRDEDHVHNEFSKSNDFTGNAQYASINAHLGFEQSRRDDMQSIAYLLIYLFCGSLPWQEVKAAEAEEESGRVLREKTNISSEDLCHGLPPEFRLYWDNVLFTSI